MCLSRSKNRWNCNHPSLIWPSHLRNPLQFLHQTSRANSCHWATFNRTAGDLCFSCFVTIHSVSQTERQTTHYDNSRKMHCKRSATKRYSYRYANNRKIKTTTLYITEVTHQRELRPFDNEQVQRSIISNEKRLRLEKQTCYNIATHENNNNNNVKSVTSAPNDCIDNYSYNEGQMKWNCIGRWGSFLLIVRWSLGHRMCCSVCSFKTSNQSGLFQHYFITK